MRNLARGLIHNHQKEIIDAAEFMHGYVPGENEFADEAKRWAVNILEGFRKELSFYPNFRLERPDMQESGKVIVEYVGSYDPMYNPNSKRVDTTKGNESLSLKIGVVLASLVASEKMLQTVRAHNAAVATYLNEVYDLYIIDPSDPKVSDISHRFISEKPVDASHAMNLLDRLTKNFDEEILRIPEDEDYFTRHIFRTGFCTYPGIGAEVEFLIKSGSWIKD